MVIRINSERITFDKFYKRYGSVLYGFTLRIVRDKEKACRIFETAFMSTWVGTRQDGLCDKKILGKMFISVIKQRGETMSLPYLQMGNCLLSTFWHGNHI